MKKKSDKVSVSFKSPRVTEVFLKICAKAPKTTVDWDKFRELDKKGIFSNFTNGQLSMKYRNLALKAKGLCWYCGKKSATERNGTCEECNQKVKSANANYHISKKAPENAIKK